MNGRHSAPASLTIFFSAILLLQVISLKGEEVVRDSITDKGIQDFQLMALKDKQNAQIWWYGWLGGYSAATAGQVIVASTTENLITRQDMILGAGTTFLGALGQLIMPLGPRDAFSDYPTVKEYVSGDHPMSPEETMELLKILSVREKEGRSWKTHAIAGAVNLSSGLITWLGFRRTVWDGLANFALNTAVTEAQIWTQPTRAIKNYEKYLLEYQSEAGLPPLKPESEWSVGVFPGGIAIKVVF